MTIRSSRSAATVSVRVAAGVLAPCLLVLAACGGDDEPAGSEKVDALTVGSDLTYPPYASLDGSTPAGFDPDIVNALAEEMGAEVKISDTRFEQLIPSLKSDRIDLIASALYITEERAQEVDYIPYFSTGNSIVVSSEGEPVADATGLCGLRVAVIKGGDIVSRLRNEASDECEAQGETAVDVREFTTDPEGTQALISGQVDAQVTDAGVASTLDEMTDGKVTISSDELLYPIPVGLAVRKGNSELLESLEEALDALKADGTYDELLEEYNLAPVEDSQVTSILGGE